MKSFRFTLVAAILVAASSSMAPAQSSHISKPTQAAGSPAGLHDFDFLIGEWRVHHRKLKANSDEWIEFDGTCSNRTLMKGQANMEEHMLNSQAAPIALSRCAPTTRNPGTGQFGGWTNAILPALWIRRCKVTSSLASAPSIPTI